MKKYLQIKFLIIFILGFSCGIPLPLTAATLTLWLSDHGIDRTMIGIFVAVAMPYSIKFLWAPFLDFVPIPMLSKLLGRRRSWLLSSQIILMALIFCFGFLNPSDNIALMALMAMAIAAVSATQDMVVDAYRIENLSNDEQGIGGAVYAYGYRLAMLLTSAGALFIAHFFNWNMAYHLSAIALLVGIITTLLIKEKKYEKAERMNRKEMLHNNIIKPFLEFTTRPQWTWILILVLFYKLCDAYAGSMTSTFLVEMGFTKIEIAKVVKTYGLIATLLGVMLGGYLADKIKMFWALLLGIVVQALSNLGFLLQVQNGHDVNSLLWVIGIDNFSGGIGSAVLVAYLSRLCNKQFTATQYALLAAIASMGRTMISTTSGFMVNTLGWSGFFAFSTTLALPSLVLLFIIYNPCRKQNYAVQG